MPKIAQRQLCYLCLGWRVLSRERATVRWNSWFGRPDPGVQAQIEFKNYTEDQEWLVSVATGEQAPTHVLVWEQPDDTLEPVTLRLVFSLEDGQ